MLQAVFAQHGLAPHEVALVGDRLYTDIRMARDAGSLAVLTLTGETKRADRRQLARNHIGPDVVIENLGELQQLLEKRSADS